MPKYTEKKEKIDSEILKLIKRYNVLPPEIELQELKFSVRDDDTCRVHELQQEWTRGALNNLFEVLAGLPYYFKIYIWGGEFPKIKDAEILIKKKSKPFKLLVQTVQAITRYEDFYKIRGQLKQLADLSKSLVLNKELSDELLEMRLKENPELYSKKRPQTTGGNFSGFFSVIEDAVKFEIDDFGIMHVSLDEFAQAINKVDILRIRECVKCKRIYWADRKDQKCCTPTCNNQYNALKSINKRKRKQ